MANETVKVAYPLPGDRTYQDQLFPTTDTYPDVPSIAAHYTASSLSADGIALAPGTTVVVAPRTDGKGDGYVVEFTVAAAQLPAAQAFSERHQTMLDERHSGLALRGCAKAQATPGAWNPMAGFEVSKSDGLCVWEPFLPLGMALSRNGAVTLMHYPPIAALRSADYLHNMTLERWRRLLAAAGFGPEELYRYCTTLDVNPIAAPGSGQSEYANDYFPTLLTSAFFDDDDASTSYVRTMLSFLLDRPDAPSEKYTLPLLVCGSPLYDPQAASWFRVRFKDQLFTPGQDVTGACPVGTAGYIKLSPHSTKLTPYLISNHMIAAGVTGRCTGDASAIPDIRQYEAQDLVAASFLKAFADDPNVDVQVALTQATDRWFGPGRTFGSVPAASDAKDRRMECALAQVDLFFDPVHIKPVLTLEQASARCAALSLGTDDPCCPNCAAPPTRPDENYQTLPAVPGPVHTRDAETSARYVVAVDGSNYELFRFRPDSAEPFTSVTASPYPSDQRFVQIGAYILMWTAKAETVGDDSFFSWRLFPFDPTSPNPLVAVGGIKGRWASSKFFSGVADFSDPSGRHQKHDGDVLDLTAMGGNFVLHLIPNPGRGTFRLWNFDPRAVNGDPLVPWMDPGAFDDIQAGIALHSVGDRVVDQVEGTGEVRVWSFDPALPIPLSKPVLQAATLPPQPGPAPGDHRLSAVGTDLLDRAQDGSWRLWSLSDLAHPKASGKLPDNLRYANRVVGLEAFDEIDDARADVPGTIDFLRKRIKHVVYYMIENRSLDHALGALYPQGASGSVTVGPKGPWDGVGAYTNPYNGREIPQTPYEGGKLGLTFDLDFPMADPYHNHSDVMRQMYGGRKDWTGTPDMQGFCVNNGTDVVMQYYVPRQLPVLYGLAGSYAASDRWFCGMPGGTDVNRAFSLTGSAQGRLDNFQNGNTYAAWPEIPHRPSVWKTLWSNGLDSFKIYNSCTWMNHVFTYHLFLDGLVPSLDGSTAPNDDHNAFVQPIDQFFLDAALGTLPAFSYLEPVWIAQKDKTSTSYHPGEDLVPCEAQLEKIYEALLASPQWSETLLVITFDEHGGLFDHVPPPTAVRPWPNEVLDGFAFDRLGPRVPTILVSPYIAPSTVFRSSTGTEYDATSFLATLLRWYGVPQSRWGLGDRTAAAPTFEGALTLAAPRTDAPTFELSWDESYPPGTDPTGSGVTPPTVAPAHDLHRTMAARDVAVAARKRISPAAAADAEKARAAADLETLRGLIQSARTRRG